MRRVFKIIIAAFLLEALLLGLCIAFPGAGHSPFLYTQLLVLWLVNLPDPSIGSCIECGSPVYLLAGGVLEAAILFAVIWVVWPPPSSATTSSLPAPPNKRL